jgi:hypothetical protein
MFDSLVPKALQTTKSSRVWNEVKHVFILLHLSYFLTPPYLLQYCSDVLQPEAILHLLGFREGVLKRDLSLPSPSAEEESLYKASSELLNKQPTSQWIYDIMRTRDSMLERGKRVRGGRKELTTGRKKVDDFIGGTRSRPKFGRGR